MNDKGISIIGAVFTLMILAIFGASIVVLVGSDQEIRRRHIEKEMAFYQAQAGLEYAVKEITDGGYPVVTRQLGRGSFTNYIVASQHLVQSMGIVGDATKTHQITVSPMAGDCVDINRDQASLVLPARTDLQGITLRKICLNAITIDKMQFSWTPNGTEKVTRVVINNAVIYDDVAGAPSGTMIDVVDHSLTESTAVQIDMIRFTSDMLGKELTMTLHFSDTSQRTLTYTITQ